MAIRNIRRDSIDKIKKMEKDGMGEDESKDLQDQVQKSLKKFEDEVNSLVSQLPVVSVLPQKPGLAAGKAAVLSVTTLSVALLGTRPASRTVEAGRPRKFLK